MILSRRKLCLFSLQQEKYSSMSSVEKINESVGIFYAQSILDFVLFFSYYFKRNHHLDHSIWYWEFLILYIQRSHIPIELHSQVYEIEKRKDEEKTHSHTHTNSIQVSNACTIWALTFLNIRWFKVFSLSFFSISLFYSFTCNMDFICMPILMQKKKINKPKKSLHVSLENVWL